MNVLYLPVIGKAVEDPSDVGAPLAAQRHVGVIVTEDPVLKVIIFKLGHILYCVILNRKIVRSLSMNQEKIVTAL